MVKIILAIISVLCCITSAVSAEVIDKVVAFVDTEAITLSELNDMYDTMHILSPDMTKREVLDTMINRALLLREARKLRIEAADEDKLLEEYIDLKFRAFIKIRESEARETYEADKEEFRGRPYEDVRESIETYLLEKEVNYRIRQHLEDLKKNAYIKVLLDD